MVPRPPGIPHGAFAYKFDNPANDRYFSLVDGHVVPGAPPGPRPWGGSLPFPPTFSFPFLSKTDSKRR